jgi:hypothetical protein
MPDAVVISDQEAPVFLNQKAMKLLGIQNKAQYS